MTGFRIPFAFLPPLAAYEKERDGTQYDTVPEKNQ
jgi:hypothetical protein